MRGVDYPENLLELSPESLEMVSQGITPELRQQWAEAAASREVARAEEAARASAADQSSFVRNPGVPLQTGAASAEQEHSRTKFVARGRGSPAPTVLPTRSERSDRERPRAGRFRFDPRLFSRR